MRELVESVERWRRAGEPAVLVRAVEVKGFGAGQYDNVLARSASGESVGAILRGLSDRVVIDAADAVLRDPGRPSRQVVVALTDPEASAGGLSCGGSARLVVDALDSLPADLWDELRCARPVALATRLEEGTPPTSAAITAEKLSGTLGDPVLDEQATTAGRDLLADPRANRVTLGEGPGRVVIEKIVARTRVVTVGTGEVVDALADVTRALGWQFEALGDDDRAVAAVEGLSGSDALVVTSHHPRRGPAALRTGLGGAAFFVGALGSRRTQERRAEALTALGVDDEARARVFGPVGLDLGGRTPAETALAICAQILAVRAGRTLPDLRDRSGPINA